MGTLHGASSVRTSDFSGGLAAFVVDARGVVSAWSPTAERLLGYETAEVVGRPVAELWPVIPWDAPQQLSQAFGPGTPGPTAVLTHRQGHPVPVTLAAYPVTSVVPGSEGTVILATAVSLPTADQDWLHHRERIAAGALRSCMEPTEAPDHSAAWITRSYVLARGGTGVNGSSADVIPLSSARLALMVCDVPASGMQATVCIGLIGAAVRALAELDLAPEEVLARLDDILSRFTAGQGNKWSMPFVGGLVGTTFLYAVYDPIARRCVMASAGHPPPTVADPDGSVHVPELPSNRPLGMGEPVFESLDLELAEGSTLLFYTGGLMRACGTDDAIAGLLSRAMCQSGPSIKDAWRVTADSMRPLLAAEDDLALLDVRTRAISSDRVVTWELPTDPAAVAGIRSLVLRQLDQWELGSLDFTTELIASELVTNAIRYGREPMQLRLIYDRMLICEVSDSSSTSPHIRRASAGDEGGRGLFLVADCAQRWGVRYTNQGKTIWAEQALNTEATPERP
ncbi:SpoIIE family protein phosphatase [Streptomyces sp. NBC_01617]|uniref:SpoIIE family protein phosphatase n=1 Tax=unclassified Streptomyces TaxID=2593676 RepID=UPI00386BAA0C|nr:SpoIIE family protein phosphatase [Streptomyces sp. NBC_01620]WTE63079.1 SpoIIE family protein phosphatase [Streptomyces sp. NBC_01617]